MSGKRWQPPHPDKPWTRQPLTDRPCAWENCHRRSSVIYNLPICDVHAELAHREVQRDRITADLHFAERFRIIDDAREANRRRLDAGKPAHAGPVPGWVYYLLIGDTIKIGYTKDLTTRLTAYPPTAQLLAAEPGTLKTERERHSRFAVHLTHGREWFRDHPDIRAWIATLPQRVPQ